MRRKSIAITGVMLAAPVFFSGLPDKSLVLGCPLISLVFLREAILRDLREKARSPMLSTKVRLRGQRLSFMGNVMARQSIPASSTSLRLPIIITSRTPLLRLLLIVSIISSLTILL